MTWINNITSKHRLSARLAAGFAISALLALGAFAPSANAEWQHGEHREHYRDGGYYRAPPVVYGSPYGSSYYGTRGYYAPPVIYGSGIGISLPGINIGIR